MKINIKSFFYNDDGSAMIEAAFVYPIALLFITSIILIALTMWELITLQTSVEQFSRCSILSRPISGIPYCGFYQCNTAQECAVKNSYGLQSTLSQNNFIAPTWVKTANPAQQCWSTQNINNPFSHIVSQSWIPIHDKFLVSYCRYTQ